MSCRLVTCLYRLIIDLMIQMDGMFVLGFGIVDHNAVRSRMHFPYLWGWRDRAANPLRPNRSRTKEVTL